MFTNEELQIIAQAVANANVPVAQAKPALELLEKIVGLIKEEPKKEN